MKLPWMKRAGRDTSKPRRRALPSLETMERREVPAGVMLGVNGVLTITATSDTQRNYASIDVDTKGTTNPFDDLVVVNWSYGAVATPTKSYPLYKQAKVLGAVQWTPNVRLINYYGNAGNDQVLNRTAIPSNLYGNDGDDGLTGGDGSDLIAGGNGNDYVSGRGGDDVLYASSYDDYQGNSKTPPASRDTVEGDGGRDWIAGARNGVNTLRGGTEGDWIYGADFALNQMEGGWGNDLLVGGDLAFNTITDRDGADTIYTGAGSHASIWCDDGAADDVIYVDKGAVPFIVCDQPYMKYKGDKVVQ